MAAIDADVKKSRSVSNSRMLLANAPEEVGPALDRAFASGVPYLVNVVTDPDDVYPRSSNLG